MKALLLLTTIVFLAGGAYFLYQTIPSTPPVDEGLEKKAYINYYLDTTKFSFTYSPQTKVWDINKADGQKVQVNLSEFTQPQLDNFLFGWVATSSTADSVSYVPNLEICRYLLISLRYTEISQMKLADFMRCESDLANQDNLVPI